MSARIDSNTTPQAPSTPAGAGSPPTDKTAGGAPNTPQGWVAAVSNELTNLAQSAFDAPATAGINPMHIPPEPIGPTTKTRLAEINQSSLSAAQKNNLRDAINGKPGAAQTNAQEALDALDGFPTDEQAAALTHLADNPGSEDASHIVNIVTSPSWGQMSSDQLKQMCQVLGAANPAAGITTGAPGTSAWNDSVAQNVFANLDQLAQSPSKLLAKDKDGNALVTNLAKIATEPLNDHLTKAGVTNAALLASTADETATPFEVQQSDFNTCTVTSMQYEMARNQPSEYARIISGLSSKSGSAATAGGVPLTLKTNYYTDGLKGSKDPRPGDNRSPTDVMFQSAAMDYGDGGHYNSSDDMTHDPGGWFGIGSSNYSGLGNDQEAHVAGALFGHGYSAVNDIGSQSNHGLDYLKSYHGNEPIFVSFNVEKGKASHELAFDHVANGRVYFRNPWGDGSDLHGDGNGNPAFTDETDANGNDVGMVSISEADYQANVNGMVKPQ